MYWPKRINRGFILLLVALFGMYGCAYQKTAVVKDIQEEEAKPTSIVTGASGAFPTGDRSTSVIFLEKNVPSEGQAGQSFFLYYQCYQSYWYDD